MNDPLTEACAAIEMARDRFADLAAIIEKKGSYSDSGFLRASAQTLDDAIAKIGDILQAECDLASKEMERRLSRLRKNFDK